MLTPPDTYAAWSGCLELFESGSQDEAVLLAMSAGSLSWTGGVATLFSERVSEALNQRLARVANDISRDLRVAGDHGVLANALLNARRKLALLHRFSCCSPFPGELAELLQNQVRLYAEQAQGSLEESARADRSGQLATILRNNSLLRYAEQAVQPPNGPEHASVQRPAPASTSGANRRRTFLT